MHSGATIVGLALLILSSTAFAAPDEDVLGKRDGYPVCKDQTGRIDERCLVGNLSHYDEIVPARVVKAGGKPRTFRHVQKEPSIRYANGNVDTFLAANRNTGLLILKGDTLLVERYQYDRRPENRFQSYSMAKTVVAMLVGIAISDGKIKSVDDLAQQYVPELKGHPYGETRLKDLLTMSSGVAFSERYDGKDDVTILARKTLMQQGPGGVDAVLPFQKRERPAGTKFSYASAETEVLSLVLHNATGKPLANYLSEKIWIPMGAEADATWLIDAGGNELGFMGLNATLRDWGRLGMLMANGGKAGSAPDSPQIIPASWVKDMTSVHGPHLARGTATRFNGYGYQTWLIGNTPDAFALFGVRGQSVFVDPESKLVIVHTAVFGSFDPSLRNEQFGLFFGTLQSLKQIEL